MFSRWIKVLVPLNLVLVLLIASLGSSPTQAIASEQLPIRDCCKMSSEGAPYCCDNCCWFKHDCTSSSDCLDPQ